MHCIMDLALNPALSLSGLAIGLPDDGKLTLA